MNIGIVMCLIPDRYKGNTLPIMEVGFDGGKVSLGMRGKLWNSQGE
jgi:hypothetical protein